MLKTLGFDRGQVRMTVAWQATTVAGIGLLVGIPLGGSVGSLNVAVASGICLYASRQYRAR